MNRYPAAARTATKPIGLAPSKPSFIRTLGSPLRA